MKKNFLIYFFIIICSGIFAEKGLTMDRESLERERESLTNGCIAGVIKAKGSEGIIVSPRGLVKTCNFIINYWIENGEGPPLSIVPKYAQISVEKMRKYFDGEW